MNTRTVSLIMLLLIVFVGLVSCLGQNTDNGSQDGMMLDELLTGVMEHIRQHHPDAADLIPDDIVWTQVSRTKKIGYSRYVYQGNDWTVSIGLAATAEPFYEVTAENSNAGITWTGTVKDSTITETEYTAK